LETTENTKRTLARGCSQRDEARMFGPELTIRRERRQPFGGRHGRLVTCMGVDREPGHDERAELKIQPEGFLHKIRTPDLEHEMARITGPERTFELLGNVDATNDLQPFILERMKEIDDRSIEILMHHDATRVCFHTDTPDLSDCRVASSPYIT
jgi:hypothetical protein